ncbi:MAG: hypothetical protein Q7R96_05930 [Nanoarchaeota archaeon]|nr:hypothetical protein [Nanoarchaeota archaeon]
MVTLQKKTKQLIWLSIIVLAITIASTIFIYSAQFTTTTIPYDFTVTTYIGINAGTDKLHFGGGIGGTTLRRSLIFTTNETTTITIQPDQEYITPETPTFILQPGEKKEIPILVIIPTNLPLGNYSGTITILQRA